MPIWFELVVMLLVTYAIGLGIGWLLWGRAASNDQHNAAPADTDPSFDDGDTL